jgi:hypothetical protein
VRDGLARAVLLPLMTSARSTLALLLALVLVLCALACATQVDASTDFPKTSLAHPAQTTFSTTPHPLPRDFSCAERVRETRTGAHHQPAYASMRKRETAEPASCQSQPVFISLLLLSG